MHTYKLTQAVTLYRSGTLSLADAAVRSGRSESEFARVLERYGVPAVEGAAADARGPAGAD